MEKTQREICLERLRENAQGIGGCSDSPGFSQRCKRVLKYVSKVPENLAEIKVHQLFLFLCHGEGTAARRMMHFWTELLDGELKAHCLAGEMPKDLSELADYKLIVYFDPDFASESVGFVDSQEHLAFAIKEFLFRAQHINLSRLEVFNRKIKSNTKGNITFLALARNKQNLILFYHPDLTLDEAASSLRILKSQWMKM